MIDVGAGEYFDARAFRDWDANSKTLIQAIATGNCLEPFGILNGDLLTHDTAVEIRSGDFVLIEPATKRAKVTFPFYTKRFELFGGKWYFGSVDGLLWADPKYYAITGRLVSIALRRRDLPMLNPDDYAAAVAVSTPEYRASLRMRALPALRALARDGYDRTSVFRAAREKAPSTETPL